MRIGLSLVSARGADYFAVLCERRSRSRTSPPQNGVKGQWHWPLLNYARRKPRKDWTSRPVQALLFEPCHGVMRVPRLERGLGWWKRRTHCGAEAPEITPWQTPPQSQTANHRTVDQQVLLVTAQTLQNSQVHEIVLRQPRRSIASS